MWSLLEVGVVLFSITQGVQGFLNATETNTQYILANDRFSAAVNKSTGAIQNLILDGQGT